MSPNLQAGIRKYYDAAVGMLTTNLRWSFVLVGGAATLSSGDRRRRTEDLNLRLAKSLATLF